MQINRPDLALPLTQKLLQGGTKTAQVYYFDGLAQNALGHSKESLADLEQAANLEPTNPGVLGTLDRHVPAAEPARRTRSASRSAR